MKKTLLTTISAMALIAASPSYAETNKAGEAWENVKTQSSEMIDDAAQGIENTYDAAKQAIQAEKDDDGNIQNITLSEHRNAKKLLGQPVYNDQGERVAKVRDIILNKDGDATMVILADGDFTGLGKLIAFDYKIITTNTNGDGDIIAALTEDMIDNAASFSYNSGDKNDTTRVIPDNGYSVSQIIDGDLVDPDGKTLANIDNILFQNGQADQVIVSFGKTLGFGGERAAIAFDDTDLKQADKSLDLQLSANESAQFNDFKKSALN